MMVSPETFYINGATSEERNWAAELLAGSEPWITLGTTLEQCRKVCWNPEYLVCIAHLNDIACGLIILHPSGLASSPYIKSVAVADAYRNLGVGSRMIAFAENHFRNNSKHIFLCVSSFNKLAGKFYEGLGYRRVGEFKDYVIDGADEILFHKSLR